MTQFVGWNPGTYTFPQIPCFPHNTIKEIYSEKTQGHLNHDVQPDSHPLALPSNSSARKFMLFTAKLTTSSATLLVCCLPHRINPHIFQVCSLSSLIFYRAWLFISMVTCLCNDCVIGFKLKKKKRKSLMLPFFIPI